MLTLYLIRHGQTDWSRANKFCGRRDPPLNATGRAMAEALGARYGDEPFDAVYASPLIRAVQTAEPLARRRGLAVRVDPDWVEVSCGVWEGLTAAEAEARDPGPWKAWHADPATHAPPQGETGEAALARTLSATARIRAAHPAGRVAVVAHKGNIRLLVCTWLGMPLARFRSHLDQPLSSVTVFEHAATAPRLLHLGDTCHLDAALQAECRG